MRNLQVFSFMVVFLIVLGGSISDTSSFHVEAKIEDDHDMFLPFISKPLIIPQQEKIFIPAGEFQMGCDSEPSGVCHVGAQPKHIVYLDAYYIDKYEVTNAHYVNFLNLKNNNDCSGNQCVDLDPYENPIDYQNDEYVVKEGFENHPVSWVSWYGSRDYCAATNGRLPTEAEWEKAARGSNDARYYPWGNTHPDCTLLNFGEYQGSWDYCIGQTTPVGSYIAGRSPYGLMDMSGNVREWVNDWYNLDYYQNSPYENPQGADTGSAKVLRGGSWSQLWVDARVTTRGSMEMDSFYLFGNPGFRCATSVGN